MLRRCLALRRLVKIGDSHSVQRTFTQEDVKQFAALVGDSNPIHLDPVAAQKARFPRPICHGVLVGSLFSNIMGMHLPGPQSVYLHQTFQFLAPVLVDEQVTATVRVKQFHKEKQMLWLDTIVTKKGVNPKTGKEEDVVCIKGTALGLNKLLTFEGESEWTYVREK